MPRLLLAVLLTVACDTQALTMRLCTLDHPFPPHTMPDGSGQIQKLLRLAAREEGIVIENSIAPRLRCLAKFKAGEVDAVISAFLPDRTADGAFPMAGAVADETRALSMVRFIVYRQKGGRLQWDGHAFTALDQRPIGIQTGLAVAQRLRQSGVVVDEGAKTIEQNLEKLMRGRVQAVVAMEGESQPLIDHHFAGQIEALPEAFDCMALYLHVRPGYYARNQQLVGRVWNNVRRLREAAAVRSHR